MIPRACAAAVFAWCAAGPALSETNSRPSQLSLEEAVLSGLEHNRGLRVQQLEPVIERRLIAHTYACRRGLGQFKALDQAQTCARRHRYFLKLDIRRRENLDHVLERLRSLIDVISVRHLSLAR